MLRYNEQKFPRAIIIFLFSLVFSQLVLETSAKRSNETLTACQHLRRVESRRAKALQNTGGTNIRIPRCTKLGEFEPVQCANEKNGTDCWCIDKYGVALPGTKKTNRNDVICNEPVHCSATSCRMFCPSGFARDSRSGCSVCKCRDPCEGIQCPGGQVCLQQEVKCKSEPCPPIPTCKKARSLLNWCPAGQPLSIEGTHRPFLCGNDLGKPSCPPLYECVIDSGNDYGVCCPKSIQFKKPGLCPNIIDSDDKTSCGTICSHDLECKHMEKCCYTKDCKFTCQQPVNVTTCHQIRALSELLAVSEREGRGYIPNCQGPGGTFSPKQCSRNGLVCWCVDIHTGHKIRSSMGAASTVNCDAVENMIARSIGRSMDMEKCDTNICAAICEYGFKNDHNGCPTCECSEPCEGFSCPMGSHCEVARDSLCTSGSALCTSIPVCKPDLAYSNPCDFGTPLTDNITGEALFCIEDERQAREYSLKLFYDEDPRESRAMTNRISCPQNYICIKLHKESSRVCCPIPTESIQRQIIEERPQSMCEYLRDFTERMEGTEEGMELAIRSPKCLPDGMYEPRQCSRRRIKVTQSERRRILEENTIRQMRKLLNPRIKRDLGETLRLYRVDDNILNINVGSMARSAKVIDTGSSKLQSLGGLFENNIKKIASANKIVPLSNDLVEVEVEECWCVDNFGTEIPKSRSWNVTTKDCLSLRESLDCLDITCRMGCEYGFTLDQTTKCPLCQCRDPCDGITCDAGKECRTVEVSCENEYCPPVPACLPRKQGQCPFLVPPGIDNLEGNACDYECRSDGHCEGTKRCCSNGCGTQCIEPQMKTACQHLQTIQRHQASELGIPAKRTYIAQCDEITGKWKETQCGPNGICWCIDSQGQEISGTRTTNKKPICKQNSAFQCPIRNCEACESGYKVDENGCRTCICRNLCDDIACLGDEECQLVDVECVDLPCPKMPVCIPKRDSACTEGKPLRMNEKEIICGPQNENEICPTTHSCQLNPMTNRGVCCAKTRDVCFESIEANCLAGYTSNLNTTMWKFSPTLNKCVSIIVPANESPCQSKNIFHSETACKSVCPVLTHCERLKLKNSMAAKRSGQLSAWFEPRCDPVTGQWSSIQCLEKQPPIIENRIDDRARAISNLDIKQSLVPGVCWCADKKGAPIKGTLTRETEPVCNYRQARRRMQDEQQNAIEDPFIEDLIRQLTLIGDDNENIDFSIDQNEANKEFDMEKSSRINELDRNTLNIKTSTKVLKKTTTRCRALSKAAVFPVACDENGAFYPTQCNNEQCWCVDAAGNQILEIGTFLAGTKSCLKTEIDSVAIYLHLINEGNQNISNLYDLLREELAQILGQIPENLRVHENFDGTVHLKFELRDMDKIDTAFAIEEMVRQNTLVFGNGELHPDATLSRFVHFTHQPPIAEATSAIGENTFQTIVFVMATGSAFLVSILVVFIMLKRGRKKTITSYVNENRILGTGDKYVDYSSPIFVLSTDNESKTKIKENEDGNL